MPGRQAHFALSRAHLGARFFDSDMQLLTPPRVIPPSQVDGRATLPPAYRAESATPPSLLWKGGRSNIVYVYTYIYIYIYICRPLEKGYTACVQPNDSHFSLIL